MTRRGFVPALEPVEGWRVVASPAALDAARWHGDAVDVVRFTADEALGIGATGIDIEDAEAITEPESGFSVALLARDDMLLVSAHMDWALPAGSGTIGQGKVAGVPAKIVPGEPALLVVQTAYADELERRLGWR
jgi:hypothetical protein